ncbi:MAG: TRAM domain-containing protein [Myxococcota bacterium]
MGKPESETPPSPPPIAPAAEAVVSITALASDGDGIARTADGRVVFVEGAVPGDRVVLGDVTRRRKVLRARIARLVEASPDRVEPACRHFGRCGGCVWQHVRYAAQLEAKRANLRAALERIGGLRIEGGLEIVASPDPLHYRARTRVVEAEGGVGYRRRSSNDALRVESCPVLVPAAEAALVGLGRAVAEEQAGSSRRQARPPRASGRSPPAARARRRSTRSRTAARARRLRPSRWRSSVSVCASADRASCRATRCCGRASRRRCASARRRRPTDGRRVASSSSTRGSAS